MDVANNFVGERANKKQLFGKFSTNDVPKRCPFWRNRHKLWLCEQCYFLSDMNFCTPYDLFVNVCIWRGWRGGLLLGQFAQPLQLFQPCCKPVCWCISLKYICELQSWRWSRTKFCDCVCFYSNPNTCFSPKHGILFSVFTRHKILISRKPIIELSQEFVML